MSFKSGRLGRHRAKTHAFFKGKHYVGDFENGNLYHSSLNHYTDNNVPIVRMRQTPHVSNNNNMIFYKMFELDVNCGTGNSDIPNPKAVLRISNDGGKTWGTELEQNLGEAGKFKTRARWHQLGRARDRVFQVVISDPVPVQIIGAYLDLEGGSN